MHVHGHVEALRELEDEVDVAPGVVPARLVVRAAADDRGAHPQRLLHELERARRLDDPLLRERDGLEVEQVAVLLAQHEGGLDAEQPLDRVDVGVRADGHRPVGDRHVEDGAGALEDVVAVLLGLELAGEADRLGQRPVAGGLAAVQQRLVEVQVRLDEARQHRPAVGVDHLAGLGLDARLDRGDALALDPDVDRRAVVPHAGVGDQQVHRLSSLYPGCRGGWRAVLAVSLATGVGNRRAFLAACDHDPPPAGS